MAGRKKYVDFEEAVAIERMSKLPPHTTRMYVPVRCPHCKVQFVEVPEERVATNKAGECLKHLRVCPDFKGSVAAAPEKKRKARDEPAQEEELVTIYKIVYLPDGRAVYTGRTKDPARRMKQHASASSGCRLLRNAIRRYGISKFSIQPIVRCMPIDADANESYYIMANKTMHPDGYNLRHGSMAGVERVDEECALVATSIVAFDGTADELRAQGEAAFDVAAICDDLEDCSATEDVCRDLLRETHPDRAGDRVFTASEVTAMLNTVRESVRAP